jgi:hypothetical protein
MRSLLSLVPAALRQADGLLYGPALDTVTAQGTAIGATIAALTAATGDSLAVKNCPLDKMARILSFFSDVQVAGTGRIRSARLHDNVQGIRFDTIIGDIRPYMPWGVSQRVYPNDVLVVELAGSAVGGDLETIIMLLYYEDLPGISARFIAADELARRGGNLTFVENTITTGTGGSYQGAEAINVEFDQFRAGGQYALVGYLIDTEMGAVCWRGPDTGNLRVAGPGEETERELTSDWFVRLSKAFNLPLIPVISSENKAATLVDVVCDENGADPTVTTIFQELSR